MGSLHMYWHSCDTACECFLLARHIRAPVCFLHAKGRGRRAGLDRVICVVSWAVPHIIHGNNQCWLICV